MTEWYQKAYKVRDYVIHDRVNDVYYAGMKHKRGYGTPITEAEYNRLYNWVKWRMGLNGYARTWGITDYREANRRYNDIKDRIKDAIANEDYDVADEIREEFTP